MATKIKWEDANFLWNNNPYLWNEVEIVKKVTEGGGGDDENIWKNLLDQERILEENYKKLTLEEKEKFVQIVVKIKDNKERSSPYIYTQKKEKKKNLDITVKDIRLTVEEVLGVKLQIENINV